MLVIATLALSVYVALAWSVYRWVNRSEGDR